uniref:Uncharacterized protein n=1 Tax=Plectus sambesii TaxID=2011161 RepID=A0A914WGT0_9BILA
MCTLCLGKLCSEISTKTHSFCDRKYSRRTSTAAAAADWVLFSWDGRGFINKTTTLAVQRSMDFALAGSIAQGLNRFKLTARTLVLDRRLDRLLNAFSQPRAYF